MNVVIVGDIGWQYLYHLGDEAMTEAAIDMLRARGVDDITLVGGQPSVAEEFYGLPAVPRVQFKAQWSRTRNDWRLKDVARVLEEQDWETRPIYTAIRDADAVLIAGGGNMNTRDYHLLYGRVAAKRIAEHFGKPLYVSSQTVGPMLSDNDRELVVEIADYARAFGCREATSASLMREHVANPERIYHTLDDALLLEADTQARASASELTGDGPYVVASFTDHRGPMWHSKAAYQQDVASLCREITERLDVDVLLVPHAGSLDPATTTRDQVSNDIIHELAASPRVRATRMITAREDVALIERAALSLSTRYHPVIFATATRTPAVAIAPSYYSSIRMRGAQRNTGFERFVLPTSSFHLVLDAVTEAASRGPALQTALDAASEKALAFQSRWWDSLVAAMPTGAVVEFAERLGPKSYEPRGEWSATNETIIPVFDKYAQEIDCKKELAAALDESRTENERLAARLDATKADLERNMNRKVVKLADRIGTWLPGR